MSTEKTKLNQAEAATYINSRYEYAKMHVADLSRLTKWGFGPDHETVGSTKIFRTWQLDKWIDEHREMIAEKEAA